MIWDNEEEWLPESGVGTHDDGVIGVGRSRVRLGIRRTRAFGARAGSCWGHSGARRTGTHDTMHLHRRMARSARARNAWVCQRSRSCMPGGTTRMRSDSSAGPIRSRAGWLRTGSLCGPAGAAGQLARTARSVTPASNRLRVNWKRVIGIVCGPDSDRRIATTQFTDTLIVRER